MFLTCVVCDEGSSKFKLRTNVNVSTRPGIEIKFGQKVQFRSVDSLEKYSRKLDHEWNNKCYAIMIKPFKLFRNEKKFQTEVS